MSGIVQQFARLSGHINQADGGSNRRVFHQIEHFGGHRRHNNPISIGQQDVTISLWQRQPHRQTSVFLPAGKGLNGGTHLLADTGGSKQAQAEHRTGKNWMFGSISDLNHVPIASGSSSGTTRYQIKN